MNYPLDLILIPIAGNNRTLYSLLFCAAVLVCGGLEST